MRINKLLKITGKVALLSVACVITTNVSAQTIYYQGTAALNNPVSVDLSVLEGLGAPPNLPELLNPNMSVSQPKPIVPPKPIYVTPMQLNNASAAPTSSLEGTVPPLVATKAAAPAPVPMKVDTPTPTTAPSAAPASGIIGQTVTTPATEISEAAKEEIKEIEEIAAETATEIETTTTAANAVDDAANDAADEVVAKAVEPATEEIQKIAAIPATKDIAEIEETIPPVPAAETPIVEIPDVEETTPPIETKIASIDPNAVKIGDDGTLSINFSEGSSDLPAGVNGALDDLASKMTTDEDLRVQLWGYAEIKDNSPSQARRLSLFRALSVRTYLMKQGVRSTRMDVRALGDKASGGPSDRVDVVFPK